MVDSEQVSNALGSVRLDRETFTLGVDFAGNRWRTLADPEGLVLVGAGGEVQKLPLSSAAVKRVTPYRSGTGAGFRVDLAGFGPSDLRLILLVMLEDAPRQGPPGLAELAVRVQAQEGQWRVRQLRWPGPMAADRSDLTAVPFCQGMLLPGDWDKPIDVAHNFSGRPMYMPWWGQYRAGGGYVAIVETVHDAGVVLRHPPGGPTAVGVEWQASLGRFDYGRSMRFVFQSPCGFVSLAKLYRRHVLQRGRFVSLAEKIARTPKLAELIGSPVVHTHILYHVQPESRYYKKDDPPANHRLATFAARAAELGKLKARGVGRAYVHLDGWGVRGYDNLHPDCLPACPEAGGWRGLGELADACHRLGYLLILHDQYRDYYLDAVSFDFRHAIWDEQGAAPQWAVWFGGRQSVLCASQAHAYVRRNHEEIQRQGVKIDGAYLDVFAAVDLDECHNPEHPMTRRQCAEYRCQCFGLIRSRGGIISSEEPFDFAVPHIDLVHWGPYPSYPSTVGRGPAYGIPVPLLNLVYHDSLIVPWVPVNHADAWGPETDDGAAHAALCGAMPYLDVNPSDEELAKAQALCRLHEQVALQELIGHELLDPAGRRRRSVFADGTTVEADLDTGQWKRL